MMPTDGKHFLSPSPTANARKKRQAVYFTETPGGSIREATEAHPQLDPNPAINTSASTNDPKPIGRVLANKDTNALLIKTEDIQEHAQLAKPENKNKTLVREILRQGIAAAHAREQAHRRAVQQAIQQGRPYVPGGNMSTIAGMQRVINHHMRVDPLLDSDDVHHHLTTILGRPREMVCPELVPHPSREWADVQLERKVRFLQVNERRPDV